MAVCTLCTLRQLLMWELWARVVATLQREGDRTVVTDAETGCSLKARELLAEVSWARTMHHMGPVLSQCCNAVLTFYTYCVISVQFRYSQQQSCCSSMPHMAVQGQITAHQPRNARRQQCNSPQEHRRQAMQVAAHAASRRRSPLQQASMRHWQLLMQQRRRHHGRAARSPS